MVRTVTSFANTGLGDWLLQRITAVIMGIYFIFMTIWFFKHPSVPFAEWHTLFSHVWMKLFTFLFFLSLSIHAWIGLWIVSTDYLKNTTVRLSFQVFVILTLFICLIWSIFILWG